MFKKVKLTIFLNPQKDTKANLKKALKKSLISKNTLISKNLISLK